MIVTLLKSKILTIVYEYMKRKKEFNTLRIFYINKKDIAS